jgi:hypothetical protein
MTPCAAWRCFLTTPDSGARLLALLASARRHGLITRLITRLITPWNIGELTIPFVFLHYAEVMPGSPPTLGMQPHRGDRNPDAGAQRRGSRASQPPHARHLSGRQRRQTTCRMLISRFRQ